ncbi:MAG: hypothetical protein RLZZ316_235 [Bacteroidota bacterium]|jgi:glycosyltransferase involved in cell wall biosynthesis
MEIIHVVLGKANPARMNGVNKVVNELATQQVMAGEEVSLWGIAQNIEHDYPQRPYKTKLFQAYKSLFKLDPALVAALDEYKDKAIFHIHGGFIPTFYKLGKELYKRKIPFVFTPHGSYNVIALEKSKWRKKLYIELYEKKLLKYAYRIHCLGKSEMDGLQQLYKNDKAVLIPYGFENAALKKEMVLPKDFVIGFCGRIDIYTKGLDVLLKAFTLFVKQHPHAELWVIGDSNERTDLQDMAEDLGILRHTTFFGSKFGEEKNNLLQQMQLFAHPSRNEGLPTAVLEAASFGIPCVVTEATNVGDFIRKYNCGEVISQPSETELYEAILKIYKNITKNGMEQLSSNAQRMVTEGFNWKTILQHFNKLYRRA